MVDDSGSARGVGGRRFFAASQSSSANLESYERMESGRMVTIKSSFSRWKSRAS